MTQTSNDAQQQRLEDLHQRLHDQVLTLADSDTWKAWLDTASRFHRYSFNNTIAIWMQRPDATQVAGYRAWQDLGRQVRKGEHGIQVLAPVIRRAQAEADNDQTTDGTDGPDDGGHRKVAGYRIAHVFDLAQTDGDPLPERPATTLLTGHGPPHLWDALAAEITNSGFTLTVRPLLGPNGPNGRTDYLTRTVTIREDLDEAQQVKTLAHELAHVRLHDPATEEGTDSAAVCRGVREVEAESVAYLVVTSHGMDSDGYSFPYVAGWAGGAEPEKLIAATGARVISTAHDILVTTATTLEAGPKVGTATHIGRPQVPSETPIPGTRHSAEVKGLSR